MIKPYYIDNDVTLYCGAAEKVLPEIDKEKNGLILTDPPYGIDYNPKRYARLNTKEILFDKVRGDEYGYDPRWLLEYENIILWGANNFSDLLPRGGWLCWDKRITEEADKMMGSPFELAWCKKRGLANTFKIARLQHGGAKNADAPNGQGIARLHPTQKPIKLMVWCIKLYADKDQVIIDPYVGSGTTLIAAKLLKRKAIGIEISEKYCELIVNRLNKPMPLFDEVKPADLFAVIV